MAVTTNVPARDNGTQGIQYLRLDVTYASAFPLTVGTLPANAMIIKPMSGLQVNVAFNAGTSNVMDVGTSADDDLYGTDLAAGSIGFVPLDELVDYRVSSDTVITCTYAQSGTAASAGQGTVVIAYVMK